MEPMNYKEDVLEVFDLIFNKLNINKEVANVNWRNPGGNTGIIKTYELENENRKIWISQTEWICDSKIIEKRVINRKSILLTIPSENKGSSISQVWEIAFPFNFSKRYNTRLYKSRDGEMVELRNYGKFTKGNKSLDKEIFFKYLIDNGYSSLIRMDFEGNKYILVLQIIDNKVPISKTIKDLVDITFLIKDYKDNYELYSLDK